MCHLDASKWQFLRCSQLEKATGRLFKILGSFFKIISIKYPPSRLDKKLNFMERDSIKMYITFCKVLECGFWGRGSRPAKRSRRDAKGRCYNLYIYILCIVGSFFKFSSSIDICSVWAIFSSFFWKICRQTFQGAGILFNMATWKGCRWLFQEAWQLFQDECRGCIRVTILGMQFIALGIQPPNGIWLQPNDYKQASRQARPSDSFAVL